MKQRDREELEIHRRLAEINGRLDALKAIKLIEDDLKNHRPITNRISIGGQPSQFDN